MARFDRTIPPGEAGNITLELRTKGYQGKIHKTARVFSNDPKSPQISIGMKGVVWSPVHIQPRYVHLKGMEGDDIQTAIELKAQKKEPLMVKLASVTIPDKVEVTLEEKEKGRTYQLTVREKGKVEGKYRGKVTLITNYPDKPKVVIPVVANIRGNLEVRPRAVTFGRMPFKRLETLKTSARPMTRSVTVLLHKGNDLKIEKVEMDGALFSTSTRELQAGQATRINVQPVLENLKQGNNQDRLRIYTNQKGGKILEVPVTFELL